MLATAPGGWARSVRDLLYVAMAVFLVTIAIGIINGLDLYEFNRDLLLTHVHSGTLGWITLGLVAGTIWLGRSGDRRLALALAALIPIYVLAFYTGNLAFRAIGGALLLVAVLWVAVWSWQVARSTRSLPGLAVALGLTTFAYGGVIGVLIQIQFATNTTIFPTTSDFIGAHAATMAFSYLVLVAMGLLEWRIKGTAGRPLGGVIQVGALFLGGLLLALTLLLVGADESEAGQGALQAAGGIDMLFNLVAVVLFGVRILPAALRTDWMAASASRYLATSSIFVVVAIALFIYLVSQFIAGVAFEELLPTNVALDHSIFIGVITNLVLGLILTLTADRPSPSAAGDQLAFWGQNLGLIVFMVGLIGGTQVLKQIGAPVMGISILLALALAVVRLRASNLSAAEAAGS
jgi:hypothetical protein